MRCFLDIETIPCDKTDKAFKAAFDRHWKRLKETGVDVKRKDELDRFHKDTALNGDFGKIAVIALAHGNNAAFALYSENGNETAMLRKFWEEVATTTQFVGHNILSFDLPFIIKRSRIHGVQPSREINLAKFRKHPVYDTMEEWCNWKPPRTSLDILCKILDVPTPKTDIDGSGVAKAWETEDGRKKVVEYCKRDVEATRKVWERLEFKGQEES